MTDLRTAAQQALEALTSRAGDSWTRRFARDRAIEALEAALAEPVQEPEPAGWFEGPFGEFRANPLYRIAWPAQTVAWSIPLYLAPPQRKPLTQEEAATLVVQDNRMRGEFSAAMELIRRTEQAHGIKE